MKREKQLTKRERKALNGPRPGATPQQHQHIHCVACGRHLDAHEFGPPTQSAVWLRCQHGSQFASCTDCRRMSQDLLDTHDRTGQAVQSASAWH